jgi:hypothetical protein
VYISLGIIYIKYTGWRGNDFTAHGYIDPVHRPQRHAVAVLERERC